MNKSLALFAVWILLYSQVLGAQQQPGTTTPTIHTDSPRWGVGGIKGWLARYKVEEVEAINLRNSSRLDSLARAGRIYLSLQDAIALALENNLDIEIQRYGPRLAETELLRARAGGFIRGIPTTLNTTTTSVANQVSGLGGLGSNFNAGSSSANPGTAAAGGFVFSQTGTTIPILDPVVSAGYGFFHRTTINSNSFATGIPAFAVTNQSPFFSIQQGFLTGTNVSLDFNNSYVRSTVPRAEINPYYTGNLGFTVTQNLLRGFGRAVNNRNIRIARNEITASDLVFQQQVISTISSIINIYWDLVSFTEDVKVKRQALALAEKLLSDNKKQVEIGTLAPIEIVRAEAEVARTQQDLTISETRLLQQETVLKNALSRTGLSSPSLSEARIVATDSIRIPDTEQIQPIQDLVNTALEKRPDIAQTRISIESSKIRLEGDRSQLRPQLDLSASVRNNGLSGDPNLIPNPSGTGFVQNANPFYVGGYGGVLRQIFSRNFPDYNISFQLNIPVHNRQARADMANDLLSLRQQQLRAQSQVNLVRVDVQNALIGVQQARAGYQAAVKSRIFAEQTLDAEQKKYALGASTIFVVIQSQRDVAQAQATEVSALSSYSRAKVQMDQALGITLEVNNVSIEEARKGQVNRPPSTVPMGSVEGR
ncbi:MAG TPA: TolC family protein [Bryobacteraceae bacterium]|nr:TolC family protein [Bryobacteraceae bacterium]